MNRPERWKRAIRKAHMPGSAVVLFDTLADRTTWTTGHLPDKRQPRSVAELARWAGQVKSVTEAAADVLEDFGWLRREKPAILRRGLSTTYQVQEGRRRPVPERKPAMSGAARSRKYRERQRTKSGVTQPPDLGERDGTPGTNVTEQQVRKSDLVGVTTSQVTGGSVQWAPVGELRGGTDLATWAGGYAGVPAAAKFIAEVDALAAEWERS